ncbi:MAG: adenylosuccinate lyase [Planctomycetes bacterium]|nr:adenylosuccinate lyase [Planctomycetota bacterium]
MPTDALDRTRYVNPLVDRYADEAMSRNFSDERKFRTWRQLWIALAEAEKELGLDITDAQIAELKAHAEDIDYELARKKEKEIRHDVMSHIYAYGVVCPLARPIIHLGATSATITDNTDLIQMRDGLEHLRRKLAALIDRLAAFAQRYRDLPCLAFTHLQPAQLTTLGKRALLWLQDFVLDLEELEYRSNTLPFLGVKGTTGTQASFLQLFQGDHEKVEKLDRLVARRMGFSQTFRVSGQTYPRKVDYAILASLAGLAASAHKMANDVRLLQSRGELEEPFDETQVGSSAMAYKRNPVRCERLSALARHLMANSLNPAITAASQFFERTLDDSANRRLSIPEGFLAADAILNLLLNVASGLVVYPKIVQRTVREQLPFMATEAILMAGVQAGGDRQLLHEVIRRHSMEVIQAIREEGRANDLLERLAGDPAFARVRDRISSLSAPEQFIGRSPQQVDSYIKDVVTHIRTRYAQHLGQASELQV